MQNRTLPEGAVSAPYAPPWQGKPMPPPTTTQAPESPFARMDRQRGCKCCTGGRWRPIAITVDSGCSIDLMLGQDLCFGRDRRRSNLKMKDAGGHCNPAAFQGSVALSSLTFNMDDKKVLPGEEEEAPLHKTLGQQEGAKLDAISEIFSEGSAKHCEFTVNDAVCSLNSPMVLMSTAYISRYLKLEARLNHTFPRLEGANGLIIPLYFRDNLFFWVCAVHVNGCKNSACLSCDHTRRRAPTKVELEQMANRYTLADALSLSRVRPSQPLAKGGLSRPPTHGTPPRDWHAWVQRTPSATFPGMQPAAKEAKLKKDIITGVKLYKRCRLGEKRVLAKLEKSRALAARLKLDVIMRVKQIKQSQRGEQLSKDTAIGITQVSDCGALGASGQAGGSGEDSNAMPFVFWLVFESKQYDDPRALAHTMEARLEGQKNVPDECSLEKLTSDVRMGRRSGHSKKYINKDPRVTWHWTVKGHWSIFGSGDEIVGLGQHTLNVNEYRVYIFETRNWVIIRLYDGRPKRRRT